MKYLKKFGALAIVAIMALSFAACGDSEKPENSKDVSPSTENTTGETPAEKTAAQNFVDENGKDLEAQLETETADVDCEVKAEENNVVIILKTAELDGITDSEKAQFQQIYDMMKDSLEEQLMKEAEKMPGIDSLVYRICDSSGEKVAEVAFEIE